MNSYQLKLSEKGHSVRDRTQFIVGNCPFTKETGKIDAATTYLLLDLCYTSNFRL